MSALRQRPPDRAAAADAGLLYGSDTLPAVLRRPAFAVLVGLALVAPSFVWLSLDRSVWPWDPAWYGQVSAELWATLRLHPGSWFNAMADAFGAKPPAIAWLGQFFVPFGYRLDAVGPFLLLSVVLCEAATLSLVFATGRRIGGTLTGAVAALAAAAAPLAVATSHEYLVEPLQGLSVAWLLYVMVAAQRRRVSLTLAQLAGAVALGLLAKLSSPFYMIVPAITTLVIAYRSMGALEIRKWWRTPSVVASILIAGLLSIGDLAWYIVNWASARAHADTIGSTLYGPNESFTTKLSWWIPHFDQAVFLPVVDWIALGAVVAALLVALIRRSGTGFIPLAAIGASLGSIVVVITLLALHPVNEIRYTMPLVPCIAVLLATLVSLANWRPLLIALAIVLGAEFGLVTAQSFGARFAARSYPSVLAPGAPSFANHLEKVVRQTCPVSANGQINVVGGDFPFLNGNTLTYLAASAFDLHGRRCYYTPLGYAEQNPDTAWQRVLSFKPPFYISLDYEDMRNLPAQYASMVRGNDPFNTIDQAIFRRVVQSPHFTVMRGSRRDGLVVFRGNWQS
jgi:4-amino-4-deoxy-L-arabinose transferase-like glycosyltransferase